MKYMILADIRYSLLTLLLGTILLSVITFTFYQDLNLDRKFAALIAPQMGMIALAMMMIPQLSENRTRHFSKLPVPIKHVALAKTFELLLLATIWGVLMLSIAFYVRGAEYLYLAFGQVLTLFGFSVVPTWLTEIKVLYPKKYRLLMGIFISIPMTLVMFVFIAVPLGDANPFLMIFFGETVAEIIGEYLKGGTGVLVSLIFLSSIVAHTVYLFGKRKSYVEKELGLT